MESLKLQSASKFVLQQFDLLYNGNITQDEYVTRTKKYMDFLYKPLSIEMFVPCDEEGNVLEEPIKYKNWTNYDYSGTDIGFEDEKLCRKYQQAKERCLFFSQHGENEIFDICLAKVYLDKFYNVEDLTYAKVNLKLTPTAIKKIGL